jgi:hypothetical protein
LLLHRAADDKTYRLQGQAFAATTRISNGYRRRKQEQLPPGVGKAADVEAAPIERRTSKWAAA